MLFFQSGSTRLLRPCVAGTDGEGVGAGGVQDEVAVPGQVLHGVGLHLEKHGERVNKTLLDYIVSIRHF